MYPEEENIDDLFGDIDRFDRHDQSEEEDDDIDIGKAKSRKDSSDVEAQEDDGKIHCIYLKDNLLNVFTIQNLKPKKRRKLPNLKKCQPIHNPNLILTGKFWILPQVRTLFSQYVQHDMHFQFMWASRYLSSSCCLQRHQAKGERIRKR